VEKDPAEEQQPAWSGAAMRTAALVAAFVLLVLPHISPWEGLNEKLSFVQRFSEWSIGKLQSLFKDYGYYVVFLGVLLENSMFLGLLVPGAIILILAGLSAENGSINLWLVLGLAVVATWIGDTLSYGIGRLGWTRLLEGGATGRMMEKVRGAMESNQRWIILAYHFAGYSRMLGPAAAGLFRVPYRTWAPLDYAGATLWVIAFTSIGYVLGLFGLEFGDTKSMTRFVEFFFTGLMVVAVAVTIARTNRRAAPATAPVRVD
jgi:membrane protein DedA with SNARE-associated domain